MCFICNPVQGIVDFAKDPGGSANNAWNDLQKGGQQVLDAVVTPVVKGVEQILTSVADNPVKTIAQVAAIVTGNAWALPLIDGADAIAKGGSVEDVLKAMAVSYVAGKAGSYAGKAVGSAVGSATGSKAAAAIASGAARSGASALVRGQDVGQALLLGGLSAGVPVALKNVPGFNDLGDIEKDVISNIAIAAVTGKDVGQAATTALVSGLITASGVVTKTLNTFDPENKMSPEQRVLATDLLMNTSVAALSGGNASKAVQQTLTSAGTKALNKMLDDKLFKSDAKSLADEQAKTVAAAKALEVKQKQQEQSVLGYNAIVKNINAGVANLDSSKKYTDYILGLYDEGRGRTPAYVAQDAIQSYNSQANAFNKTYEETYKPQLDKYTAELAKIQEETSDLEGVYKAAVEKYATSADIFSKGLAPVIKSINEAYATTLDPNFSALDYAKSAGLDANKDDVYAHWLEKGQFEGIPTNKAAVNLTITNEKVRLIEDLAKAKGISLAQITDTDAKNFFAEVDKKYGGDFVAIQKATIQDLVSGDAKSLNELLKTSEANGYRVDVSGTAKGAWDKPEGYTPPEGMRLATVGEKDNGTGILSYTDKGAPVWIAQSTSPIKVWDPKQGDYVPVSWGKDGAVGTAPTTVVTAPRLKEDDYVAWAINASRTPNGLDEDLWNFGSTIAGLKAVAATAASGLGEQLQTWGSAVGLATGGDMNNFAVQTGTAMEEWGKANTTEDIKKGMAAVQKGLEAAQKVEGFWPQSRATLSVVIDNPMAYVAYLGQEGFQEVVPLGAGFVTAAITSAFASPIAGVSAGATVATVIEGLEVFGSTGKQVYDALIKEGRSDEYARSRAIIAGTTAAATSAPANAAANAALLVPFLRAMGAAGVVAGGAGVAANQVAEYAETYTQTLITQAATNKPLNFAEANVSATFASVISGGTTGVTLAPTILQGTASIGKDVAGNNLTWEGLTTGKQTPATVNGNVVVGKDSKGKDVTLAEAAYNGANSEAGEVIRSSVYTPRFDDFLAPYTFTPEKAKQAAAAEGYALTDAEAAKWVGFDPGSKVSEVKSAVDPKATTLAEAKQMMSDLGYTKMSDQEALALAGQISEVEAKKKVEQYVAPRVVTFDEAKAHLESLGYKPTAAEVNQFVGAAEGEQVIRIPGRPGGAFGIGFIPDRYEVVRSPNTGDYQAGRFGEAANYVAPRMVTEAEAKAEYEKLGIKNPTKADIDKLVGQYDQNLLTGKATENLDAARYNSILAELDALSQGADQETLAEIEKTRAEVTAQLEATNQATQERIAQTETSLTKAIDDAKRAGLEGDAALSAGIDKVAADLGVTKDELLTQLGTTETQLRQDLATQIGGVQTQISDVDAAIRAEIAKNEAAGMARDVATAKAVDDVAVQLGVTKDELIARVTQSETALGQQITGLSQEVQTKYDTLNQGQKDIVTQLAQQGVDLNKAIDTAAATVSGQVSDLSQEVQTKYDTLNQGQKDIVTQLTQQGVDLNTAIDSVAQQVTQTQDILGRPGETATQSDVDAIINLLQTQGAYDPRYDFDGNKKIDQSDRVAVEQYIRMRQPDYIPDETIPTSFNPAAGSKWASTGLFSTVAGEAERTRQAQAAEAERTRQAQLAEAEKTRRMQAEQARRAQQLQLATAQKTQRMGNVNTMMGMLSQAPDLYGQQVSVKTPDPVNIRGAYDWSSIFGSPAQEKMFVTPYAGGGAVRSDVDTVNDELINLLRG